MNETLKQKTAKGLFWGGLSHGTQQLLSLIFGIFLSRMLDNTDYGMIGKLAVFSLIAGSLQESGFIAALANRKEVTHQDYNAVFWFSVLIGAVLYLLLFFCAPLIALFYNNELTLIPLSRFYFLAFFISSFAIAPRAYLFRNLKTRETAITSIIALVVSGTVGVIFAYHGMAYWGIATQTVVFSLFITLFSWYFARWKPNLPVSFEPIRQMIGFSSKLLITNIFIHINNNIFSVIWGKVYSSAEVGNYSQANKWNTMGYSFVAGTIQGVAQPIFAKVNDEKERQRQVFRKMLRFTAFISFPLMFGLSLIAKELIVITITEKWLAAVVLLQILAIDGAFIPIVRLYSNLIISKGKSNIYMWNTVILCLIQLMVILQLLPYGEQAMVTAFVAINVCWLFVWHYFVWREIGLSLWSAWKDIVPFAGIALLTMIATYYLTQRIENIYLLLITKVVMAAILYLGVLRLLNARILKESLGYFLKKKN